MSKKTIPPKYGTFDDSTDYEPVRITDTTSAQEKLKAYYGISEETETIQFTEGMHLQAGFDALMMR